MINVILKDGSKKEVKEDESCLNLAKSISEGLARNMTAVLVDGNVQDLRFKLEKECNVEILTFDNSLERKESLLAHNISYYGTSCKKTISKCETCNRACD